MDPEGEDGCRRREGHPLKGSTAYDVHPAPVRDQERRRDGETGLPGQRGSAAGLALAPPQETPSAPAAGPLSCEPRLLLTPYMPPSASPAGPKFRASQARSAEEGAEVRAGRTAGHAKVSRRLKPLAPCIRGRDEGQRQAKRQAGPPAPASSAASCTLDAFGTLACDLDTWECAFWLLLPGDPPEPPCGSPSARRPPRSPPRHVRTRIEAEVPSPTPHRGADTPYRPPPLTQTPPRGMLSS